MGQDAYFSPSFARLGKVPDAGITRTLSRRIGGGRAIASLMLADKIDAKNALRWGIVYCVVPNSEVVAHAVDVAKRLAKAPDNLLRRIRELNSSTYENSIGEQLKAERRAQDLSKGMRGCAEGIDAFFQKREPQFEEL
jgi:2-(1,2-epoxy-1,2-dihydrophenyl)acetyl-CoA isomerase